MSTSFANCALLTTRSFIKPVSHTPLVVPSFMFYTCMFYRAAGESKPEVVKPPSRIRKTYTVYDENDVAYKVSTS